MSGTVIAGGGLAGASAACLLAASGRDVTLFERQAAPAEKICGEFISFEAQRYFSRIGIDLAALGAHGIHAVRLVHREKIVSCTLPFTGLGLSRRVLDEALLRRAAQLGAEIRRGEAIHLRSAHGPIVLETASGDEVRTDTLFLATGKHDLRGLRRRTAASNDLVGFKVHLRLAPSQSAALAGHVELIMLPDGYAGLQLVNDTLANLCLLVATGRLQRAGGTWDGLFEDLLRAEPHLRARLAEAVTVSGPISISRVPYGFVHAPSRDDPPGIFRLGDQMGVIPSFTGDGMSIAMHSAILAAGYHLAGSRAAEYHRVLRGDILGQIRRATALNRIATSAPGRIALMRLAAIWPAGMRLAARMTRVPSNALLQPAEGVLF
jgi:flavin-dependent dehydrogenase